MSGDWRYYVTITPTRFGYTARLGSAAEGGFPAVETDGAWWRLTKRGIERLAARKLRRLTATDDRHAQRYRFDLKSGGEQ